MKSQLVKSLDISWRPSLGLLDVKSCVGVGVGSSQPPGIYPPKRSKVPEYMFSVSDPSPTMAAMGTTFQHMALVCVHSSSVTKSQKVLPVSAEHSLSTMSTIISSDPSPEEITSSRLLKEFSPVVKIPRK